MKRYLCVVCLTIPVATQLCAQELRRSIANDRPATRIAFSPDGKTLASGSGDTVKIWDLATGKNTANLKGHTSGIASLAFSPDGNILASGGVDRDRGEIRLWEVASRKDTAVYKLARQQAALSGGPMEAAHAIVFTPDGKTLISGSGDSQHAEIKFWGVATGRNLFTIRTDDRVYLSLACSPGGRRLASGDFGYDVNLWDIATRKRAATLKGHDRPVYCVAFSPDGKTLASASGDKTIKLWDVATGKNTATLEGHKGDVLSIAFSPDGKLLASGGTEDKNVRIWNVATGKNTISLGGHTDDVYSVAFSPDGKTLASGSWDGTIKLWDVKPPAAASPSRGVGPDP